MVVQIVVPMKTTERKIYVYGLNGEPVEEYRLPPVFNVPIRVDLIKRAFLSAFTAMLQPKGRDPMAGRRTTARSWGVGYGLARVPRIPTGRAAFVSFARGGHLAFAPTPDRRIHERVNKKERVYAIVSALAATSNADFVKKRGHVFKENLSLPVVIVNEAETNIGKARDAKDLLEKIGVWSDIERSYDRTRIRAGKGKMRGRRYVEPRSVLFVLSSYKTPLAMAVRNFPGVDVATPINLSVLHLAPGGVPGRLTVFSLKALEEVSRKYTVMYL